MISDHDPPPAGTLEALQEILIAKFGMKRAQLGPDAQLASLGVDSLGVLEMMFEIEDRFALKIKDDVPTGLVTLGDVVTYVDGLLARRRGA